MTPPLAFVWNEEGQARGAEGLGSGGLAGQKEGVLAPDSEFRWIGWAVGTRTVPTQYWHGLAWEEVLALDMEGGRRGRGAKGLSQQKCPKVKMEGKMRPRSTKSTY